MDSSAVFTFNNQASCPAVCELMVKGCSTPLVNSGLHFNTKMMKEIGRDFCKTLVDYVMNHDLVSKILAELKVRYPQGGTSGAPGADFPVLMEPAKPD